MAKDRGTLDRRRFIGAASVAVAAGTFPAAAIASPAKRPTIFATGGSFFPQAWEKSYFPEYLLALAPAKTPKICWLGAASGENPAGFEAFARGMEPHGCVVRHFNIFQPETLDFTDYLMAMDIVVVGGGSTRNMMALWRDWGFDKALRSAWQQGVVMAGASAGMICWFQGGLTDSFPKVLAPVAGLGILPGSANPHARVRPDRLIRFGESIASGVLASPGLALDNDVGALFRGTELVELVSCKNEAGAWRLTRSAQGYDEARLPVRFLGS